ncbi:MAG: phosphatase PAP2 family protein [Bacteroidaceae bacterium]|nr:phosphatase PAP2 family protein [Bacteroidaceae bacterium]
MKHLTSLFMMMLVCLTASANNIIGVYNTEPLKVEIPEWNYSLTTSTKPAPKMRLGELPMASTTYNTEATRDVYKWAANKPGIKPYKFMDDMTFVGVPMFVAGILLKSEKNAFRQNYKDEFHANTRLLTNFKTSIDDYTQYFGPAMTLGLKIFGYEGRSDWRRFLVSAGLSYGVMGLLVNTIKYSAKEMRPDGSTANSWPSGHTANSFVGATILHKEYGLTRSPWFSVAGYGIATATGVMRVLNNRHWISDVMSGAGIGIFAGELGYAITDLLFKEKGLLRNDLQGDFNKPSFFSISMGVGLGSKSIGFSLKDLKYDYAEELGDEELVRVDFRSATTVDAEGAYFFNKYVGVGGRLRVRTMPAKNWDAITYKPEQANSDLTNDLMYFLKDVNGWSDTTPEYVAEKEMIMANSKDIVTDQDIIVESDHLSEFSASVGLYFNIPLSKRFAIGTKVLVGRSIMQELDLDANYKGNVKDIGYKMEVVDGEPTSLAITRFNPTNMDYEAQWDYMTMGGQTSTTYGTGISLTYRYKSNFSWKVFFDYDYSRKTFTLKYDPYRYLYVATPNMEELYTGMQLSIDGLEFEKTKKLHYYTIGGSFTINF